jgi:hypothetical protein
MNAKDHTAVATAVNGLLCLDGKGCMAEFDILELSHYILRAGLPQVGYKEVTNLSHSVTALNAEGSRAGFNIFDFRYFWRISQVLNDYSLLLKTAAPDPDLLKKLNVRFKFDELIPRLSAACLKINRDDLPKGFYEKLEKAVLEKEYEEKDENKEKEKSKDASKGNVQDEGEQDGKGQNNTNKSPMSLGMKIFLACAALVLIVVVIGLTIYFFIKRK